MHHGSAGQFLTHPHTVSNCRSVPFTSALSRAPRTGAGTPAEDRFQAGIDATLARGLSGYRRPDLPPAVLSDLESLAVAGGCDEGLIQAIKRPGARRRPPESNAANRIQ